MIPQVFDAEDLIALLSSEYGIEKEAVENACRKEEQFPDHPAAQGYRGYLPIVLGYETLNSPRLQPGEALRQQVELLQEMFGLRPESLGRYCGCTPERMEELIASFQNEPLTEREAVIFSLTHLKAVWVDIRNHATLLVELARQDLPEETDSSCH